MARHDTYTTGGFDRNGKSKGSSSSNNSDSGSIIDSVADAHLPQTPPSTTTLLDSKKERVRYSWQSIHDDEPNRPRIHIVKIVSNTATASAASPQGEPLAFSLSAQGKRIAAYNSARLFVFQTAALPVNVSHEYALRRRPLRVDLCDEANVLAVLADEHTVNVYDLSHNHARRLKTIRTDLPISTIALSTNGALLAAAYQGGVEVFSLAPNALITDRRAVRAPKMDKLVFSQDDSTLLGTTTRIFTSSTLIISVPLFSSTSSGIPLNQELQEAWCTGMLEPQNVKNSSHATFMRQDGLMTNDKLFAWNGAEDTFGLLDAHDMVYSHVDFPVAISPPLSTCGGLGAAIHHTPSIDEHGKTVAMIVNDRTVRLYIVPADLNDDSTKVEAHSIDHELDEEYGCPFTDLRWVHSHSSLPATVESNRSIRGRLVVASPGGFIDPEQAELDVEGGRIILLDFDPQFAGQPGQTFVLHVGKAPPLTLEEETMDVADEIALVRRRTITSTRSNTLGKKTPSLGRAATTVSRRQEDSTPRNGISTPVQTSPWKNRRTNPAIVSPPADASRSLPDLIETSELTAESSDDPYVQGAPRSFMTLERTAANPHRFQTLEEQQAESARSGDLPLPAYTELPNQPLPGRYRALAGLDIPSHARFVQPNGSPISANTASATLRDRQFLQPTSSLPPAPAVPPHTTPFIHPITSMASQTHANGRSDWNPSQSPARSGTQRTLRTQPSWETVSTSTQVTPRVAQTLRSQPSWESAGTMSLISPEMTQGAGTVPTSPEHMRAPQMIQGLGLQDCRNSVLLPQRDRVGIADDRPRTTASDTTTQIHRDEAGRLQIQHRPPHVQAMQAVNHAAANNLVQTYELAGRNSTSGISTSSSAYSSSDTTPTRPATSAGAVGYTVTGWFPPVSAPSSSFGDQQKHRADHFLRSKTAGAPLSSETNARAVPSSPVDARRTRSSRLRTPEYNDSSPLRRSKSVAAGTPGRKAWFAKKKAQQEAGDGPSSSPLPRVGAGVRDEFLKYEAQGKKCIVM
jgi:hypothetical protein